MYATTRKIMLIITFTRILISNFTQIDAGNTTLAGYPAYKIVYTANTDPFGVHKVTDILMVKDGNVYEIQYSANLRYYDTYADTAQKMIDSFQIK